MVVWNSRGIARRTAVVAAGVAVSASRAARASIPNRRRAVAATSMLLIGAIVTSSLFSSSPLPTAEVGGSGREGTPKKQNATSPVAKGSKHGAPASDRWTPCAVSGQTCKCTGTLVFGTVLGAAVREVNVQGQILCSAEALGAPASMDPRVCWCQKGIAWDDDVRSGLASIVRQGLNPRIEIASEDHAGEMGCDPEGDGLWYGCVTMSKRCDATVVPQVMMRAAPPEEQLDMSLRKLDACHRLAPHSALRIVGVRSGQSADAVTMPVSAAGVCSMVYSPTEGAMWTAEIQAHYCATEPGSCTTTPCECRTALDSKMELKTPQGQKCWACAEPGAEYKFRVNTMAEKMEGGSSTWWPPYGINCPPILWAFMDWRMVMSDCPAVSTYFILFLVALFLRKFEEISGGLLPWTKIAPLFGPPLKRGEIWRFVTYTFFHLQFFDLFQHVLTMLDTLDIEGTPAIILGDGSNLKCGVGAKPNFMCYPSIGIGSVHTFGVAITTAAIGGMCCTWINFTAVVTGASAVGFGLSGAVVGLYGLYAGAELDQATSVQRSFQDWVHLRLIFVAFHIVMEWIRAVSQRDASGLIAHTASFISGFGYVMYFLPPMGDGTMFPSSRPYVVPCAYDVYGGSGLGATDTVPECIRLFSAVYEYEVTDVHRKAGLAFFCTVMFTVFNALVLQKNVPSGMVAVLGNVQVKAVLFGPKPDPKDYLHIEVIKGAQFQADAVLPAVEVRVVTGGTDPCKKPGGGMDMQPEEPSQTSRYIKDGGAEPEFKDHLFLKSKCEKGSFVQFVVRDQKSGQPGTPVAFAALPMKQVLRNDSMQQPPPVTLPLQEVTPGCLGSGSQLTVRVRGLTRSDLAKLKQYVQRQLGDGKNKIAFVEQRVAMLQHQVDAEAGGHPTQ